MAPLLLRRTAAALLSATALLVISAWPAPAGAASSQANAHSQTGNGNAGHGPAASGPPVTPGTSGPAGSSQSTSGAGNAPPGNNGHIQIEELNGTAADIENGNDPHVPCAGFIVEFFGYDGGPQRATLILTPWAPTPGSSSTLGPVTWDVGTRTNGNQSDASYTVSGSQLSSVLASSTPVAQGYHLRIEVEVTGSQGADDKFHMLWIAPCTTPVIAPPTPTVTPTTPVTPTTTDTQTPTTSPVGGTQSVPAGGTVMQDLLTLGTARLPVTTTAAITPSPTSAGDSQPRSGLAFTGAELAALVLAGLSALIAGILLQQRRRQRRAPLGHLIS
jgi:hypothetical protein